MCNTKLYLGINIFFIRFIVNNIDVVLIKTYKIMLIDHLFMGGISFMLPIYVMWIIVLFFTIKFIVNYYSENRNLKKLAKQNSLILFIGSFAFLFGLLGQILGLYQALVCIQTAGDISPALIAGGLSVSLIAPIYGFILFIISGIIWYIFRSLIKR